MEPDTTQQLAQLADIHGAADPGWWPPAPGWWLLALVLIVLLLRVLLRRLDERRRRQAWLDEIERLEREHSPATEPQAWLAGINRLFRAIAVRAFPDTACARLEGDAWVAFVTGLLPENAEIDGLAALARGPYEPAPVFEKEALDALARQWVALYG